MSMGSNFVLPICIEVHEDPGLRVADVHLGEPGLQLQQLKLWFSCVFSCEPLMKSIPKLFKWGVRFQYSEQKNHLGEASFIRIHYITNPDKLYTSV